MNNWQDICVKFLKPLLFKQMNIAYSVSNNFPARIFAAGKFAALKFRLAKISLREMLAEQNFRRV